MEQLQFTELNEQVYEIDEKATRKEALDILSQYRRFKLGTIGYDIKLTPSYSIEPKTFSNEFNSNVENNVIKKLDYMLMVEQAVNRIEDQDQRFIIVEGYMGSEKPNWIKLSSKLHVDRDTYYKIRNKALGNFASALNKEVFIE